MPPDCREDGEQKVLLDSILALLRQYLNRLQVATDEGSNEVYLQVDAITIIENGDIKNAHVQHMNCEGGIHASDERNMHVIHESDSQKRISPTKSETCPSPDNTKCNDKLFARQNGGCISDSLLLENNSKHSGRRQGKEEKTFSLEVIQQYFTGSLKNAAKSLGVCPTTMKRICRQHGISRWPSRQISKVNRTVSKLKKVIESVEGHEGAFTLTSVTGPLPVAFGPSNPISIKNQSQINVSGLSIPSVQENRDSSSQSKLLENDIHRSTLVPQKSFLANINRQIEAEKASNSRNSSKDCRTHSGRSEESYPVSPANMTFVSTLLKPQQNMYIQDGFTKESFQKEDLRFHGMFVNGSGSLKDCKNHITSAVNGTILGHPGSLTTAQNSGIITCPGSLISAQNSRIVTVKARYKEDLLRFRFPCSGSFITLKDEVAKRIQMDGVLFDIKYLDDDHEWVKLTCDTDLEECMEISRASGSNVLRLLVTDIAPVLGSSCGSTG